MLSAFAKVVRQVPKRGSFIIAGDFNTSLRPHASLIGPRVLEPTEKRPDEQNLTNLLVKLRLVALNTWQCAQTHTYEQGATATQIDYILTKETGSGTKAKQSGPWRECPLGSWKHFAVLAEVHIVRHRMLQSQRGPRQQYDVAALRRSVRTHDSKAQEMQKWVEDRMQSCAEPEAWNALLIQATELFFPKPAPSREVPLASVTRRMWRSKADSQVHINASDASVSQSPPSIQLSGPLVAQPALPLNGEQSVSGLQRLELAQAEHNPRRTG